VNLTTNLLGREAKHKDRAGVDEKGEVVAVYLDGTNRLHLTVETRGQLRSDLAGYWLLNKREEGKDGR
jgi:hypothetical protein